MLAQVPESARATEDKPAPQVGCFAPTNRAIRELCQRVVAQHGVEIGFNKIVLIRSSRAELGESAEDTELLLPVDMRARVRRICSWLFSPTLNRLRAILGKPLAFLNDMRRGLEERMESVDMCLVLPSKQDLAELVASLKRFQDGLLFEILHRELKAAVDKLRKETSDIQLDVSGASRDERMRQIASAQRKLDVVLACSALDSVLARLQPVVSERHRPSAVAAERQEQERAFEERVLAIIADSDDALASINELRAAARERRAIIASSGATRGFRRRLVGSDEAWVQTAVQTAVLSEAAIVFSTTKLAPLLPAYRRRLNCVSVLVDEAGQVPESDLAAIADASWERLILAGDDKQLPAVVTGEGCEQAGYGRSLLERLRTNPATADAVLMLDTQFRMDPMIAAFSSQEFYEGRLMSCMQTPNPLPTSEEASAKARSFFGGIVVFDTSGLPSNEQQASNFSDKYPKRGDGSPLLNAEYRPAGSTSFANDMEIFLIRRDLEQFEKTAAKTRESWSVGVIAPYASQVALLKKALVRWMQPPDAQKHRIVQVAVGTVDSFQGSEADIILLPTVRSNRYGTIGFLASERRLNVAFTRARFGLWIYCNVSTLGVKQGTIWGRFLKRFVVQNAVPIVRVDREYSKRKAGKFSTTEQDTRAYFTRESMLKQRDSTTTMQAGTMNVKVLMKGLSVDDLLEGARRGSWVWMVASEERVEHQMRCMRHALRLPVAFAINQLATGKHFTRLGPRVEYTGDITQDFPNFAIDVLDLQPTPSCLLWYVWLDSTDYKQMIIIAEVIPRDEIQAKRTALASRLMSGRSFAHLQACCVTERPLRAACIPKQFSRYDAAFVDGGPVCARAEADVSRELRKLHIVTGREWLTQVIAYLCGVGRAQSLTQETAPCCAAAASTAQVRSGSGTPAVDVGTAGAAQERLGPEPGHSRGSRREWEDGGSSQHRAAGGARPSRQAFRR